MALLVMASTVTITIEKHFCGDRLIDVSVFSELERCGMEGPETADGITKSCCKDTIDIIDVQDELQSYKFDFSELNNEVFVTTFLISQYVLFEHIPEKELLIEDHSPPDIYRDINILHEVFLI